jgi:hypothetical protein
MWHVWERTQIYTWFWFENLMERGHLEDLGIDEDDRIKICSTEIGKGGGVWIGFMWLRWGPVAGCDEQSNETSCPTRCCWFECPSSCRFLKKVAARRNYLNDDCLCVCVCFMCSYTVVKHTAGQLKCSKERA